LCGKFYWDQVLKTAGRWVKRKAGVETEKGEKEWLAKGKG